MLDENGLAFALGRTSRSRIPILNPDTGDFIEAERDSAPYTTVVLDIPTEVCAIGRTSQLAASVASLGRRLALVLEASRVARPYGVEFDVSPIPDPDAFVEQLRSAHAIKTFTATFTRPNPFDAEKLFHEPLERLVEETRSRSGSATLKGQDLDEEPLVEITRSVASTGDDARATLQFEPGQRPVRRNLKGDTASISEPEVDTTEQRRSLLGRLRAKYQEIRGRAG